MCAAPPPLPLLGAGVAVVGIGYQSHQSRRSPLVPTHLSAPWAPTAAPATAPATIPAIFRGLLPVQIVGKQPAHRPWSSRSDHYPLTHPPVVRVSFCPKLPLLLRPWQVAGLVALTVQLQSVDVTIDGEDCPSLMYWRCGAHQVEVGVRGY